MLRYNPFMMDEEMPARVKARVIEVCERVGFGEVAVVIEKGRLRRLRVTQEPWLEERTQGPPGRDVGHKLTA